MDLALHNFLMQYRYANANNQVDAVNHSQDVDDEPYPDTRMLVDSPPRPNSSSAAIPD